MPTDPGDIVILLQKAHDEGENLTSITSSARAQGHLRRQQKNEKKGMGKGSLQAPPGLGSSSSDVDPLPMHDPWRPTPMDEDLPTRTMVASLEERAATSVQKTNEERFQKLEVDMAECSTASMSNGSKKRERPIKDFSRRWAHYPHR